MTNQPPHINQPSAWVQITPTTPRKRRVVSIIGGIEKTGKTTLAASGDDPVYILSIDRGSEAVILRSAGRRIFLKNYTHPRDLLPAQYTSTWETFKSDFYGVLKINNGTLIVDTETAMYDLIRLARFGKILPGNQDQYGPLNGEINSMMDVAFESNMNIIMVRRAMPVFRAPGQWEDRGWGQMPFVVDMRIWTYRCLPGMCPTMSVIRGTVMHTNGGFHARIRDSRWKAELIGMDYSTEPPNLLDLRVITSHVYDDVKIEQPKLATTPITQPTQPTQPTTTEEATQ